VILAVMVFGPRLWQGRDARLIQGMIGEAPSLIARIPDQEHPSVMAHWFKALAKAGYTREAKRMAASIDRPAVKNEALAAVATGLFEAMRMDEAAEVARSIPDPKVRDQTLRMVSMGFALSGGLADRNVQVRILGHKVGGLRSAGSGGRKSVATASEIKDASQRDSGLVDSSRTLRIMNDDRSADAADRRITDATARDEAQTSKAWTLALKGRPRAAFDSAAAVREPTRRVFALVKVAGLLARRSQETGNPNDPLVIDGESIDRRTLADGAVRAAERALAEALDAKINAGDALSALADIMTTTRRFAEAREAVAAIPDAERRSQAQIQLVGSLAEAGTYAEAMTLARAISQPRSRSDALTALIEASAKASTAGNPAPSHVITDAANAIFATALENEKSADRSEALEHASHALVAAGRPAEALRAAKEAMASAREVAEQESRAYAVSDAAGAWARAQPGPKAAEAAREALVAAAPVGSPYWDDGPLQRAARALTQALPAGEAVEFASAIEDPLARALALTAVADILGGYGWRDQVVPASLAAERALQAAQAIREPGARATTIAEVTEIAGRAGLVDQARAAIRSIPDSLAAKRSEACQSLAILEAERVHFDRALEVAQGCSPGHRLSVFGTILNVYATQPARRRFAHEATSPAPKSAVR
jgi:hypothetical protein